MADVQEQTALLWVNSLCKHFGGVIATDHVSLDVKPGEVHAVIGPNGAGKTTLIAQLSGMLPSDSGKTFFAGEDISAMGAPARARAGLARSFQVTSVLKDFSTLANVALAVQSKQGHSYRFWRQAQQDPRLNDPAREILAQVGLADQCDTLAGNLAHGQQRQLEMAIALALQPRLLLLDEPMAGMGAADSALMIHYLASLKERYAMLLVEHDMDAVFALADRITVLVYGKVIASGLPDEIRIDPEVRQAYLGED